jgi:2-hydroxy-6-oxonona-2,4-dienedioate hydrolase
MPMPKYVKAGAVLLFVLLAVSVDVIYQVDLAAARQELLIGSAVANTACGPIEYSDAGSGPAVLAVHGAGGGYIQMEGFSRTLVAAGFRVISVSRFGYLRTPLPADSTPEGQAAAHACILDTLGITKAAVLSVSAGAPSSMRFCLRYRERCKALVLLVPAAFAPGTTMEESTPPSPYMQLVLNYVLKSDFLMWVATRVAPDVLIETVLATPIHVYRTSDESEQARALSIIRAIFPVSQKLDGLRNDAAIAAGLPAEVLANIRAPTLAISAEDDLYHTLTGARYAAEHIPGARLVVYRTGGHAWLGHEGDVSREVVTFLRIDSDS